jgi:hypothetical protein
MSFWFVCAFCGVLWSMLVMVCFGLWWLFVVVVGLVTDEDTADDPKI